MKDIWIKRLLVILIDVLLCYTANKCGMVLDPAKLGLVALIVIAENFTYFRKQKPIITEK